MTSPSVTRHWVRHAMSTAERELLAPSRVVIPSSADRTRIELPMERAALLKKIFRSNLFLIYL